MNRTSLLICIALAGIVTQAAQAQFIDIRVSYKVVLNPANGQRPLAVTNERIDSAIANMNRLLQGYARGYRIVRVDPIVDVGGQGDTTGPSKWFDTDFHAFNGGILKAQMEFDATIGNPGPYAWNASAINLYFTAGICGGICSFPVPTQNIIILGGCAVADAETQLHEIGHYFNLFHTQGDVCGCSDPASLLPLCNTIPGDDHVGDTLPDLPSWSEDQIATWSFGTTFGNLSAGQQSQVDDVFFNLMSYHGPTPCGQGHSTPQLTEKQLDRWTDTANGGRNSVCTGLTRFVDKNSCLLPAGNSSCNPFGGPLWTVEAGINAANPAGGDIVLIRPGIYNEQRTFSKPVTLRATRLGGVTIGQ